MASNRWLSALLPLALAACGDGGGDNAAIAGAGLEQAARDRGLVRDAADAPMTGLYTRGGDRICIVERGGGARFGVVSDYGDGIACAATGAARRIAGGIDVTLGAAGDCRFEAQFDGDRILLPARLPEGCKRFCAPRASLSAIAVDRLSDSIAEASALREPRGRLLCSS